MSYYALYWLLGLIVLPGIILASIAQIKVYNTYNKMRLVNTQKGLTANQIAREVLDNNGLTDISLTTTNNELGDHYHPKKKYIALSPGVSNSSSIASVGIAMHEVGHALQDSQGYFFSGLRKFLCPLVNFCSVALWPLVIIGMIFSFGGASGSVFGDVCLYSGIAFFGMSVLFSLINLPTELDASKRAMNVLREQGYMDEEELAGVKQVLSAAAMTYVASLLVSILNLLRFLLSVLLIRNNE